MTTLRACIATASGLVSGVTRVAAHGQLATSVLPFSRCRNLACNEQRRVLAYIITTALHPQELSSIVRPDNTMDSQQISTITSNIGLAAIYRSLLVDDTTALSELMHGILLHMAQIGEGVNNCVTYEQLVNIKGYIVKLATEAVSFLGSITITSICLAALVQALEKTQCQQHQSDVERLMMHTVYMISSTAEVLMAARQLLHGHSTTLLGIMEIAWSLVKRESVTAISLTPQVSCNGNQIGVRKPKEKNKRLSKLRLFSGITQSSICNRNTVNPAKVGSIPESTCSQIKNDVHETFECSTKLSVPVDKDSCEKKLTNEKDYPPSLSNQVLNNKPSHAARTFRSVCARFIASTHRFLDTIEYTVSIRASSLTSSEIHIPSSTLIHTALYDVPQFNETWLLSTIISTASSEVLSEHDIDVRMLLSHSLKYTVAKIARRASSTSSTRTRVNTYMKSSIASKTETSADKSCEFRHNRASSDACRPTLTANNLADVSDIDFAPSAPLSAASVI